VGIEKIQRPELFFGIVGPVGVDIDMITDVLITELNRQQYYSRVLKVTSLMEVIPSNIVLRDDNYLERIKSRISYANDVCKRLGRKDALAAIVPSGVQTIREEWYKKKARERGQEAAKIEVERPLDAHAYIIRQFKRPVEIKLLRQIYGKLFFQISAYSSPSDREDLITKKIKDSNFGAIDDSKARNDAIELMAIDYAEEKNDFGQKIRETFPMADVFVDGINRKKCEQMIHRFVNLIFGDNSITPDRDENGMYLAKSSSLRSGDLSRQVGAAICRSTGEVISLGCNEVPKFGGGPYWCDDVNDARDFAIGEDPNDRIKREVLHNILDILFRTGRLSANLSNLTTKEIMTTLMQDESGIRSSKVMDLLEFGRVIHAEMAALVDAARFGLSVKDAVLYGTTFPCHICAKHIVAAGITRVVFLEPYPKSYARELHVDSIEIEGDSSSGKVKFDAFMGISPHRYRDFFENGRRKGDDGKANLWRDGKPLPIVEIYMPIYPTLETIVSAELKNEIERLRAEVAATSSETAT